MALYTTNNTIYANSRGKKTWKRRHRYYNLMKGEGVGVKILAG